MTVALAFRTPVSLTIGGNTVAFGFGESTNLAAASATNAANSATDAANSVATISDVRAQNTFAFATVDTVAPTGRLDGIAVAVTQLVRRVEADGFSGWGQTFTTPGSLTTNAVLVTLARGVTAKKWARIDAVLRTHATDASSAAATVVAKGSLRVDPDLDVLDSLYILWRDPVSNAPITVTQADLDAQYGVMCQAFAADGSKATAGEALATISGAAKVTSYYVTTATAATDAWSAYAGNSTIAVAAVDLNGPVQAEEILATVGMKAATRESGHANLGLLRRIRAKANDLKQPTPISAQMHIGFAGDSWSTTREYYLQRLARALVAQYGDGGVGWFGLGWFLNGGTPDYAGDARGLYYTSTTGTWTSNYHAGSTSPDISDTRSSEVGATIKVASNGGAVQPALSAVKLHFTGTADGVIKWRWGGGAWSANTNVQGTLGAQQVLDLTGFPTAALTGSSPVDTNMVEIQVVSGSVILCGIDFQAATDGVVIHKLGASGSKVSDWAAVAGANWGSGLASLRLDAFTFLSGTNDSANGDSPDDIRINEEKVWAAVETAIPHIDKLVVAPPENQEYYPTPMSQIAEARYAASATARAAFLNLQAAFGDDPDEYGDGGLGLLLPGSPHPTYSGAVTGAAIIAGEMQRTLFER